MRTLRRVARVPVLLALALLVAGCGDDVLWARWRAERGLWVGWREVSRIAIDPYAATDAEFARARAAFARVSQAFPATTWARAEAVDRVREVGTLSGRARLGEARVEVLHGRDDQALAVYTQTIADYRAIEPVALEAAVGRALLLDRTGPATAAEGAWREVGVAFAPVDAATGAAVIPVLEAPLRVAALLTAAGDKAGASAALDEGAHRIEAALAREGGRAAAPELWLRLSDVRAGRGDGPGARAALRRGLAEPEAGRDRPRMLLALAARALADAGPDSALAYAAWGERTLSGADRAQAIRTAAEAWEARGVPDSALARYERLLDAPGLDADATAQIRLRRATVLERTGRWEEARIEYRALAGVQPTHPLALEALLRIVEHHRRAGEQEMAALESRRAIDRLDQLLVTVRDAAIQWRVRHARVRLMRAGGNGPGAAAALAETWARFPEPAVDDTLGLELAREATAEAPERALELYRALASRAGLADTRRVARAAIAGLRGEERRTP